MDGRQLLTSQARIAFAGSGPGSRGVSPSDPQPMNTAVAVARVQTQSPRRRPQRQARDGCVVPTDPLADLVRGFLHSWNRERPSNHGQFSEGPTQEEVTFVGGTEWLVMEAGVSRDKIQSITQRRQPVTELHIADALVGAIGRPEVFHDGTLQVMPNPRAARAARDSCCGSLTI